MAWSQIIFCFLILSIASGRLIDGNENNNNNNHRIRTNNYRTRHFLVGNNNNHNKGVDRNRMLYPPPSKVGQMVVTALKNKLTKEFGSSWTDFRPYKIDEQEGVLYIDGREKQINGKNNNRTKTDLNSGDDSIGNNNSGENHDISTSTSTNNSKIIPKRVQDKIDKEYIKQNQVELFDSYDSKRNVYILTTKTLPIESQIQFDFSFSSADGSNRCRVLDGKYLSPMDQALTEAVRKKLHFNNATNTKNSGNGNINAFLQKSLSGSFQTAVGNIPPQPLECSITGFANIFTFTHYGYDMNNDENSDKNKQSVNRMKSSSWWTLYENNDFKVAIETLNVKVDFKAGKMVKSLIIRKKFTTVKNDPSINKKNNEGILYHVFPTPFPHKSGVEVTKKCNPLSERKDENIIVSTISKSDVLFKIIYLPKDKLKLYVSTVQYDESRYLNLWLQHLDTKNQNFDDSKMKYGPALCTVSSLNTNFYKTKQPKPTLLNYCREKQIADTNDHMRVLRKAAMHQYYAHNIHNNHGLGLIIRPLPELYEIKSRCSAITHVVANKNCVSNMLRSPNHSDDIIAIGKNEAIGYSFSRENIDFETTNTFKNDMKEIFKKENEKVKVNNPWAIKIFWNFEQDENNINNWKFLKTIEKQGFQVISDTAAIPQSVAQLYKRKNKKNVQFRFVQSSDSCKCCRDLFMRSIMLVKAD